MRTFIANPTARQGLGDTPGVRRFELDWLRTLIVLGIIPYHVLVIFGASSAVYIKSAQSNPALGFIGGFVLTWGIPTLFLLAGAACRLAIERHGPRAYVRERLSKLLAPMALVALVLSPLQTYFILLSNPGLVSMSPTPIQNPEQLSNIATFYGTYLTLLVTTVRAYTPSIGTLALAHVWFIPRLLIVSLLVVALVLMTRHVTRRVRQGLRILATTIERYQVLSLLGAGLATAFIVALLRPGWLERVTAPGPFTDVWSEFVLDLALFVCGYLIYWSVRLRAAVRDWRLPSLAAGLLCWSAIAGATLAGNAPMTSLAPSAIAYAMVLALTAWFVSLAFLGFALRYLTFSTPWQRYLTSAAFPVYVIHMPVLTVAAYYLLKLPLPWYGQLLLITSVTLIVAFGLFDLVIRRTPVTRLLFGARGRGPQEHKWGASPPQPALPPVKTIETDASTAGADDRKPTSGTNLALLFRERSARYAQAVRWRQRCGTSWRVVTFAEQHRLVNQVISALDALGARPGETIGILSGTRWEWIVADWAITGLGGVTATIYPSLPQKTVAFMLRDSGARYLFIEDENQYEKLRDVLDELPKLRRLIIFDEDATALADPRVLSFDTLLALNLRTDAEADTFAEACAQRIQPDDQAALIYTSGTTGQPKGVIHTHRTLLAQLAGARAMLNTIQPGMVDTLFLPLSHVMGRLEHLFALAGGDETIILPSMDHLAQDIAAGHPHFLLAVPRVFEKAHAAILERVASTSPLERALFQWGLRVGQTAVPYRQRRQSLPMALRIQLAVANALVFRRIRAGLGGQLQFAITGSAPLDPAIITFFHAVGVPLLEGWGLTETGGAFTVNQINNFRIGSVGRPFPGHEIRLAADGEILVRGPCLFPAYQNNPEATAEALDNDGWFHTGDIGTLDDDGFLTIVDRKKELIVTAGGKKVAPQLVEGLLEAHPLVAQACIYGDRKPYVVALLTLDWQAVAHWADQRHLSYADPHSLASSPALRAHLDEHVAQVNAHLARFEQIKYYDVLTDEFTVANGLLTPTQKIRREVIAKRYRTRFEALYPVVSTSGWRNNVVWSGEA